jgi:hypothetical protein
MFVVIRHFLRDCVILLTGTESMQILSNKKNIYRLFYLLLKSVIFLKSDGQQFHH